MRWKTRARTTITWHPGHDERCGSRKISPLSEFPPASYDEAPQLVDRGASRTPKRGAETVEYLHIVPYLIELREITETALYEYSRLDEAARRWCELDRQLTELALTASTELDDDEFAAK